MSTKSVFVFNYNPNEKDKIIKIIKQYLSDNNFTKRYDIWTKKYPYIKTINPVGFEYDINNNELIIKAYTLGIEYNTTRFIHSILNNSATGSFYYRELKRKLFKELKKNNVLLNCKKREKINDNANMKTAKNVLIFTVLLVIFTIICLLFMKNI